MASMMWKPVTTGTAAYHCKVYNRWGEVFFETDDP